MGFELHRTRNQIIKRTISNHDGDLICSNKLELNRDRSQIIDSWFSDSESVMATRSLPGLAPLLAVTVTGPSDWLGLGVRASSPDSYRDLGSGSGGRSGPHRLPSLSSLGASHGADREHHHRIRRLRRPWQPAAAAERWMQSWFGLALKYCGWSESSWSQVAAGKLTSLLVVSPGLNLKCRGHTSWAWLSRAADSSYCGSHGASWRLGGTRMNFRRPTVTGKRFVNGNLKSDSESATRTQRLLPWPEGSSGYWPVVLFTIPTKF